MSGLEHSSDVDQKESGKEKVHRALEKMEAREVGGEE
jgi:hypothetical protein